MERYPEHRFACSQGQQFKWLEQVLFSVFMDKQVKLKALCSNTRPSLQRFKRRSNLDSSILLVVPGLKMMETCHLERRLFDSLYTDSGISNLDLVNDARRLGCRIRLD